MAKDQGKKINFDTIAGGLRTDIFFPSDYPPVIEEELIDRDQSDDPSYVFINGDKAFTWQPSDELRYKRLYGGRTVNYYPLYYPQPPIPSRYGRLLWNEFIASALPDNGLMTNLIADTSKHIDFLAALNPIDLTDFNLNPEFNPLFALPDVLWWKLIKTMATTLRGAPNIKKVTLDNARLIGPEGLRLLLAVSIACGDRIEELNVWYFFKQDVLPLRGTEDYVFEPLDCDDFQNYHGYELVFRTPTPHERELMWSEIVMTNETNIKPHCFGYVFDACLYMFRTLHTLYVEYSWLCGHGGLNLCKLTCLRKRNLKNLYVLCTYPLLPDSAGCCVHDVMWCQAKLYAANLKVHFVIMNYHLYDEIKLFLSPDIPMDSLTISTGSKPLDYKKCRLAYEDCIIRTIIDHYSTQLRKIDY